MSDFLVERPGGHYFDLVSRTDGEYGMVKAINSDRLPTLLGETDLENSFLATYISQLSMGAVDADLLYAEGSTLLEELCIMSERTRAVSSDDNDGFMRQAETPEDEAIWSALRGFNGVQILDNNGYSSIASFDPFEIRPPDSSQASFILPTRITSPLDGLVKAVHRVEDFRDNPNATHCMDQYTVVRDAGGRAVHVSAECHLTVGWVTKLGEFVSYAALIEPIQYIE